MAMVDMFVGTHKKREEKAEKRGEERGQKRPLDLTSVSMNYSFTRYFIHSFMHAPWQLQSSQVVKTSLLFGLALL